MITHSKPYISNDDVEALRAMLMSGMIAEGELTREFERKVSQFLGLRGGVATSSGTSALLLSLRAMDIGTGDEVIIPTYVCRAVWDAVVMTGATAVLCDVGEEWCMTIDTVRPHLTKRTRAIIEVHIFGIVADIAPICQLGIPVIEDCCQSFGAMRDGKMAGRFGQICFLSFHATKLLTTGEGGMVLTDDFRLLDRLHELTTELSGKLIGRYRHPLSDLQSRLGLNQLIRYNSFIERRKAIAEFYFDRLAHLPLLLPHDIKNHSVFFRFPLRVRRQFDELRPAFDREGVQVRRGVDALLHAQLGMEKDSFPEAERLYMETVSIPLYPALTDEEAERVANVCEMLLS